MGRSRAKALSSVIKSCYHYPEEYIFVFLYRSNSSLTTLAQLSNFRDFAKRWGVVVSAVAVIFAGAAFWKGTNEQVWLSGGAGLRIDSLLWGGYIYVRESTSFEVDVDADLNGQSTPLGRSVDFATTLILTSVGELGGGIHKAVGVSLEFAIPSISLLVTTSIDTYKCFILSKGWEGKATYIPYHGPCYVSLWGLAYKILRK